MAETAASIFREGRLSLGLVLPLRAAPGPEVDFLEQIELAALADRLGFAAVWVRDVPLNGPWYPEAFGHLDPFAMLGAVAARTRRIAIGTAATVLTLREPLLVAKAAISLAMLSEGRFVLGLGSGDRMEEFAAFGRNVEDRRTLFRSHWETVAAAVAVPPVVAEGFEMRPTPSAPVPMLAVGSGGQTLEWIARNAAGWATYHRPAETQRDRYAFWRRAVERHAPDDFRSFSVAVRVELLDAPDAPTEPIELGYRGGAASLRPLFEAMRDEGVHHVLLNLAPNGRPPAEQLAVLAEALLPAVD